MSRYRPLTISKIIWYKNFEFRKILTTSCDVWSHRHIPIIVQQDATVYSLFISVSRTTCFGWCLQPSSGAHVTVSTASGISKPVTVTCHERDWTWAPDDGWRYHPKYVERLTNINKLYIAASCWTIIGIYFAMHGPLNVKVTDYLDFVVRVEI